MVVFFSISGVATPPSVSIPRVNGVTSSKRTSLVSPDNTDPCIAAPTATASSGFRSFLGSFLKKSFTLDCTRGILVWPPTNNTSLMSPMESLASSRANFTGARLRSTRSSTKDSSFALVTLCTKCLGPEASAVMYGRFTSVCSLDDNSIFAFSAASFSLCKASGSDLRSKPDSFLNSSTK